MPVVLFCLSIPINKKEDNKKIFQQIYRYKRMIEICISYVLQLNLLLIRVLNAIALILFTDISIIIDFDRGRIYFKNVSMCFNIFLTSKIVKRNQRKHKISVKKSGSILLK